MLPHGLPPDAGEVVPAPEADPRQVQAAVAEGLVPPVVAIRDVRSMVEADKHDELLLKALAAQGGIGRNCRANALQGLLALQIGSVDRIGTILRRRRQVSEEFLDTEPRKRDQHEENQQYDLLCRHVRELLPHAGLGVLLLLLGALAWTCSDPAFLPSHAPDRVADVLGQLNDPQQADKPQEADDPAGSRTHLGHATGAGDGGVALFAEALANQQGVDPRDIQYQGQGGDEVQPEEEAEQVVILANATQDHLGREQDEGHDREDVEGQVSRLAGGRQPDVVA
mmetsp:Transcript_15317/g.44295  ORF Transcript_15317/g.44295 Transcript_15317/m.44295 type:complete len:282 (+) Transcript_15317:1117-1962(+)